VNQEAKTSRDSFIDLARGICALSIVFIHTVFWSGSGYVPTYVASLSLLIDIPAFFFLSGMACAGANKVTVISVIFRLSSAFGLLALVYDVIFFEFHFKDVFLALTLSPPQLKHLPVVTASYWFVPVYVVVTLFGLVLLNKIKCIYIPLLPVLFSYYLYFFFMGIEPPAWPILGVNVNFLIFYLFMYLFGHFAKERIVCGQFKQYFAVALLFIGGGFLFMAYGKIGLSALDLQSSKFPVGLPYVSASLLSISAIIYYYSDLPLRSKWLEHVGRNAVFYYVGQGIGASILLIIVDKINIDLWQMKLLFMFTVNLIITIMVSEGLRCVFTLAGMSSKYLLPHMNSIVSGERRSSPR